MIAMSYDKINYSYPAQISNQKCKRQTLMTAHIANSNAHTNVTRRLIGKLVNEKIIKINVDLAKRGNVADCQSKGSKVD